MPNLSQNQPEIIVSDETTTKAVSRSAKSGKLRKLASRLYTTISRHILEATNAFIDPTQADLQGIHLTLPDDTLLADIKSQP